MSLLTNTMQTLSDEEMSAEKRRVELEHQRERLGMDYRHKLQMLQTKRSGARIVYANQADAANEIVSQFLSDKRWVVLVAPPGSGKTGVILEVLRILGEHPNPDIQRHIDDMIVLTGMSDTDWKSTMVDGMLPVLAKTVHHRGMLSKVDLGGLKNGIIVTDECHVACQVGQTIDKALAAAGLKNIETLQRRNMFMLDVSATPEGVLHDLRKWRTQTAIVMLVPDEKYKGFQTMKDEGRLRSVKDFDLDTYDDMLKLVRIFDLRYTRCATKKYFAFRLQSDMARQNLREACENMGWARPVDHDSKNRVEDIDAVMSNPPGKHTIFLVKGFWRASKRLVRLHVGGTVESNTTRPDDSTKSQGLSGRGCSTYDWEGEQEDVNLRPIHFDDIGSIDRYLHWFDSGCDYKEAAYCAPRMKSDGRGNVRAPKTKVDPGGILGIGDVEDEDPAPVHADQPEAPIRQRAAPDGPRAKSAPLPRAHKAFQSLEEAKACYLDKFGSSDGLAMKPHKDPVSGKYQCSFANMKAAVYDTSVVAAHLGSGNLWGGNGVAFKENTLSQIGTVKIGYTGDVPTFYLCVQGRHGTELTL